MKPSSFNGFDQCALFMLAILLRSPARVRASCRLPTSQHRTSCSLSVNKKRHYFLASLEEDIATIIPSSTMSQQLVIPEDEGAMRDAIKRIFTALPDALTVLSLNKYPVATGSYILGESVVDYPLPTNGRFRALLDDDMIWWSIAAISNLIPMYDGSHGVEWNEASEDSWDSMVDSTYEVLHELCKEYPYHVWYGEELLQAIQERLL